MDCFSVGFGVKASGMIRAGFVGLVGLPNAGKSTFLNFLVQHPLAIVTPKPQTTRQRVAGIISGSDYQWVLWDSPGVVDPKTPLNRFLHHEYQKVLEESDLLIAVLNVDAHVSELSRVVEVVAASQKAWQYVVTKVDLKKPQTPADEIHQQIRSMGFSIKGWEWSIHKPDALVWRQTFVEELSRLLPESPDYLYDPEWISLEKESFFVAEIIREAAFLNLKEEIPYQLGVKVRKMESYDQLVRIYADIVVAKESQKPIVVGQSGQMIKKIGSMARLKLEEFLGKKVFLSLYVVVKENWMDNPQFMKDLGYRWVSSAERKKG